MSSRERKRKAWCLFFVLASGITALDLWTKKVMFDLLEVRGDPPRVISQEVKVIIPNLFELEATYNQGAFYGLLAGHTEKLALLSILAVVAIIGVLAYSLHRGAPSLWFAAALGLICGGTAGNLYDRYYLGAVRDWIKWFVVWNDREYVWPNFNIADSAICTGVGLLILLEITAGLRERRRQRDRSGGAVTPRPTGR